MKKIIFFSLLGVCSIVGYSQKISNVDFQQVGNNILVSYSLSGLKTGQVVTITLFVSTDGDKTFKGPLKEVRGDVGENIQSGAKKNIQWEVMKEMPDFGGNVVFDVRALIKSETEETVKQEKPDEKDKIKETKSKPVSNELSVYAGLNGSIYAPLGLTGAIIKGKFGGYISGRLNPKYFSEVSYNYDPDVNSVVDYNSAGYYLFNGNDEIKRLSVMLGGLYMPHPNIGCYLGAGLSKYELLWEIQEFDYPETEKGKTFVSHDGESFVSYEAEAGIILSYKRFILGAGVSSPKFQWFEGVATLAYNFF